MRFKLLESLIRNEYEKLTVDELLERTDSAGTYGSETDEWIKSLRKAAKRLGVNPWTKLVILKTSTNTDLFYYVKYYGNFSFEKIGNIPYITEEVGRSFYVYFKSEEDLDKFIEAIEKAEEDEI